MYTCMYMFVYGQTGFIAVTITCALCPKDASAGLVVRLAWRMVHVRPKGQGQMIEWHRLVSDSSK